MLIGITVVVVALWLVAVFMIERRSRRERAKMSPEELKADDDAIRVDQQTW